MPSSPFSHSYQTAYATNPAFTYPQQAYVPQQTALQPLHQALQQPLQQPLQLPQQQSLSPLTSRKRRASELDETNLSAGSSMSAYSMQQPGMMGAQPGSSAVHALAGPSHGMRLDSGFGAPMPELSSPVPKKGRTNTPWTPAEEQRLKQMRDAGNSWSEIAKTFPMRTEGSVKKHWYKVSVASPFVYMFQELTVCRTCITPNLWTTREVLSASLGLLQARHRLTVQRVLRCSPPSRSTKAVSGRSLDKRSANLQRYGLDSTASRFRLHVADISQGLRAVCQGAF